ncbi:MAG: hypothetical protein ACOX61_07085 [Brooklawnia sp.]|jgi:hypothetical protein
MMKFSKTLLLVLGAVASIAFIGVMIYAVIKIDQQWMVAISMRSQDFANPRNWALLGAGLGLLAGLLLGLGFALPGQSFKARYAEVRRTEQIADAKAAGFNGARSVARPDEAADPAVDIHQADPQ